MSGNEEESTVTETQNQQPAAQSTKRSLLNIATIVAIATLLSKIFGLLRQVAIAAAFGNGTAYGAYNFAYVIPGFLLILLGGINGPFHSAIVSVLAKRDRKEVAAIIDSITTIVTGILLLVSIALVIFAEPLLHLVAPGLFVPEADLLAKGISFETIQNLKITKDIAIQQFQIMAPMAVLAGLVGIGFGALNAADAYWLPSVSPIFSSLTVLIGIGGLFWTMGSKILLPENAMLGGAVLAWATLAGAVLQWLVQLPVQIKAGMGGFKLRFDFQRPEVKEVMKIMIPATFSSGMLQINVWTDLFFASFLPNAAAAVSSMGYAGLLVQTPLGILSNVILVPLFPVLSKLTDPENWGELKSRIRQGLMLTALTMLPLSGLMVALAMPISQVVYERYAFDTEASQLTAIVLMAYSVGMFVYLGRDVLVRVFYAQIEGFLSSPAGEAASAAVMDIHSHEADLRLALGRAVSVRAEFLAWAGPSLRNGFAGAVAEAGLPPVEVTASDFEWFRARLGRRTVAEVSAYRWSADPEPYLDAFFVFGRAGSSLGEVSA